MIEPYVRAKVTILFDRMPVTYVFDSLAAAHKAKETISHGIGSDAKVTFLHSGGHSTVILSTAVGVTITDRVEEDDACIADIPYQEEFTERQKEASTVRPFGIGTH